MQEELTTIWQNHKRTVLFVTHDIEEAVYLSDRVIVFSARPGRLKADIVIDLPRPRMPQIRKSVEFQSLKNRIWDLLREEVLSSKVMS
jgi:NitT/TauT family transport system ATP-binding protein